MKKIVIAACLLSTAIYGGESSNYQLENKQITYLLTLSNGEKFTVLMPCQKIHLHDGDNDWVLNAERIRYLTQEGWLSGEYLREDGAVGTFDYTSVNDRLLRVQLTEDQKIIDIPWLKLASLTLEESYPTYTYEAEQPNLYLAEAKNEYRVAEDDDLIAEDHEDRNCVDYEALLPPDLTTTYVSKSHKNHSFFNINVQQEDEEDQDDGEDFPKEFFDGNWDGDDEDFFSDHYNLGDEDFFDDVEISMDGGVYYYKDDDEI